jgi:hypothetical protein
MYKKDVRWPPPTHVRGVRLVSTEALPHSVPFRVAETTPRLAALREELRHIAGHSASVDVYCSGSGGEELPGNRRLSQWLSEQTG